MRSPRKCSNYRNRTPAQVKPTISAELLDLNRVTIQAQISHQRKIMDPEGVPPRSD
jgi:hypothetical protein